MGGPTYHYDAANPSKTKFPAYFDGKNFAYEYGRAWIKTFTGGTDDLTFPRSRPGSRASRIKQPIDMQFGPDGALYVLDYGTGGFFQGDANSAVYRIDYVQGARSPIVKATADKTSGPAPLTVKFSAEGSLDPDGTPLTYAWDFDGDGTTDSTAANPTYTYTTAGKRTATLKITDATGQEAFDLLQHHRGQHRPDGEGQPARAGRDLRLRRQGQVHRHRHRPRRRHDRLLEGPRQHRARSQRPLARRPVDDRLLGRVHDPGGLGGQDPARLVHRLRARTRTRRRASS